MNNETTTKGTETMKNKYQMRKPCKRCESWPATRGGHCAQCRRELAALGAATTVEDIRKLVAAVEAASK